MINIIVILISLASIAMILFPLLKFKYNPYFIIKQQGQLEDIELQIETSYREIQILIDDHNTDNIDDEQFDIMISASKLETALLLKQKNDVILNRHKITESIKQEIAESRIAATNVKLERKQ